MEKYHINTKTGRANICRPIKTGVCGLKQDGQEEPKHYNTKEEAQAAYEADGKKKFGETSTLKREPKQKTEYFIYVDCRGRNTYAVTQAEIDAESDNEDVFGNKAGFGYCDSCNDFDSQVGSIMSARKPTKAQIEKFIREN